MNQELLVAHVETLGVKVLHPGHSRGSLLGLGRVLVSVKGFFVLG